jgi:hypothetical protein
LRLGARFFFLLFLLPAMLKKQKITTADGPGLSWLSLKGISFSSKIKSFLKRFEY